MKNKIQVALGIALMLTSCAKRYTCSCTETSQGSVTEYGYLAEGTKKNLKKECEGKNGTKNGVTTRCQLAR